MKLICTLLFVLLLSYSNVSAQSVNDVPISELEVEYVRIVGTSKNMSNKVKVEIDFGQENKFFSSNKDTMITDKEGKKKIFESMIDALNFMHSNGYEFVSASSFSRGGINVYHYMLRRM